MADNKRDFDALLKRLAAPNRASWERGHALVPGLTVDGRYRIVQPLGRGGMGEVYEVEDLQSERRLALKCLLATLMDDEPLRARFVLEAESAGRLSHPNLVQVLATGSLPDGRPYLCMELLTGRSLQRELEDEGPLPEARLCAVGETLCEALSAAHVLGFVHRDLKPANVFSSRTKAGEEQLKLMDFGVAKQLQGRGGMVTTSGVVLGTPHFMSPEQVRADRELDARSDLYSLGVLLYYCATGRYPFRGKTFAELAVQISLVTPPAPRLLRPTLSPAFERVIRTAMQRLPEDRFPSAAAFKLALTSVRARAADPV